MMDAQDLDHNGLLGRSEWLAYFKKLNARSEKSAQAVLAAYKRQINENKDVDFEREVLVVFDSADKDHNGQLDMKELSNVRNSEQCAQAMMDAQDLDHDGLLSRDEWPAYFRKLRERKEQSAKAVLAAYRRQIDENRDARLQKQ